VTEFAATDIWPEDAPSPNAIPDFQLIRLVGEGTFGQVWLAKNRTTGGLRAVKVIRLGESGKGDLAGKEIISLSYLEQNVRVQHANLVRIQHVGKTSDYLYYTMDLADGISGEPASCEKSYKPDTLSGRLQNVPWETDDCLRRCRELLAGLASLHQQGMVHRDVKPANCIFVGGELKLADFGLLTEASRASSLVGTPMYMPPDLVMDRKADVYAAGLVLYEMLTGLPVRRFPSLGSRARVIVKDNRLRVVNRLAVRACERARENRYIDAVEMLEELDKGLASATSSDEKGERQRASSKIRQRLIVVGGIAAIGLAAAGAFLLGQRSPEYVDVNFVTDYYDAMILLDGVLLESNGTPYKTPCTVPNVTADKHNVVFKHPKLDDLEVGEIDFIKVREVVAHWEAKQDDSNAARDSAENAGSVE